MQQHKKISSFLTAIKLGSPVTMHWGFDIVEFIKKCSGLDTSMDFVITTTGLMVSDY